jgi:hypothetical protein
MSNGQQAKANSARPMRPGGVLVNFPAAQEHPPESPAPRVSDLPAGSDPSLFEACQELPLYCSEERQWDKQSFSLPSRTTGREPEPVTVQRLYVSDDEWSEHPVSCNRPPLLGMRNRNLCRLMNPSFNRSPLGI